MKKFTKIMAVVLALLICCVAFASCGGDNGSKDSGSGETPAAATSVNGETQTWGNITVLVPDGMSLKGGNVIDEKNPDVVNISKKDKATDYFLITLNDSEDSAETGVESTKKANKGSSDVEFEAGEDWKGVSYEYSGTPAFQIYAEIGDRYAVVQSFGFAVDDEVTKSVLSSIKVKEKDD